jgi:hypothetical protein
MVPIRTPRGHRSGRKPVPPDPSLPSVFVLTEVEEGVKVYHLDHLVVSVPTCGTPGNTDRLSGAR